MATPDSNSTPVSSVSSSVIYWIDALVYGVKWGSDGEGTPAVLTYSFPNAGSDWSIDLFIGYGWGSDEPWNGFRGLSIAEQGRATAALNAWSSVANISFVKVADNATTVGEIRFGWTTGGDIVNFQAQAYLPDANYVAAGDVWLNADAYWDGFAAGSYGYMTLLHEVGHALGLQHSFDGPTTLPGSEDSYAFTLMSYSAYPSNSGSFTDFNPTTPMLYDIAAMQYLYGANMSYHTGNDTYTFKQGYSYFQTIWDAGGIDTIVWSATNQSAYIDLRGGHWSDLGNAIHFWDGSGNTIASESYTVAIYDTVTIENATGGNANDFLNGNSADNMLNGGKGVDVMVGGLGNDTYFVDSFFDTVSEFADEGSDSVRTTLNYALTLNIENAIAIGIGAVNLTGNDLDNTLTGNTAANVFDGGIGADTMAGGKGNDVYLIDILDTVTEMIGGGTDAIHASWSYTLAEANVENLTLTLGAGNIDGTGNTLANVITGNAGNNTLDGGTGVDRLIGGLGDDTYVVDLTAAGALQDVVTEALNAGADTIELRGTSTNAAFATLTLGAHLENLDASATGSSKLNLTGNTLANTLSGNDANNVINGGLGADTLVGGLGNDTYVVDNVGDVVVESSALGTEIDLVKSSVSFDLTDATNGNDRSQIENLSLTGLAAINATGNDLDNTLTGNAAANVLDGGLGADTLKGGLGNDTYVVDDAGDMVSELLASGRDMVLSSIDYTLGSHLENLTLTAAAVNGTGNALANVITGNAADNTLSGLGGNDILDGSSGADTMIGGAGRDTLTGGADSDTFVFNFLSATSADVITDFVSGVDRIALDEAIFSQLSFTGGVLDAGQFVSGTTALDSTDHLLYNSATGQLFFDSDGNGTSKSVLLATLGTSVHPAINEADLVGA